MENRLHESPPLERVWILSLLDHGEEALRLAHTPPREALVRHQIGRRLFDEARYRESAAEFEWASDLYRASGRDRLANVSLLPYRSS